MNKKTKKKTDSPKSSGHVSRRGFIKRAVTVGSALAVPSFIPASALGIGAVAPSDRIVLGGIGLGNRGRSDLLAMIPEKDVQFVATCDVRRGRRQRIKEIVDTHYGNTDCVVYRDMFELLDRPDVDAVLIATGDRWHALASILTVKAGKDVYCEKPCGITIGQVQAMADAVNRYGRVFQVGTQRRSQENFQYAAYLAHSGRLGKLHTLHASVYMPYRTYKWLPAQPEPAKNEVDWDRWLGPCPWRPYNEGYLAGWRGHYDFEGGDRLLDWGAHTVDLCQWANQSDDTMPLQWEADEHGITGYYASGVKLRLYFLPDPFGDRSPQFHTSTGTCPVRFEGDEGWVETGDNGEIILSDNLMKTQHRRFTRPGTNAAGHGRNFFDCVKTRALPVSNQNITRSSHVACYAAALSWELKRKITFDPVKEMFVDDEEANRSIVRAARAPWSFYV
jgi:predicted dehydrogenase